MTTEQFDPFAAFHERLRALEERLDAHEDALDRLEATLEAAYRSAEPAPPVALQDYALKRVADLRRLIEVVNGGEPPPITSGWQDEPT